MLSGYNTTPCQVAGGEATPYTSGSITKKDTTLKVWLDPWLEEAYQVSSNIQEKLVNLQLTQQKIKQDREGPTTENLVERVKQAIMHSVVEIAAVKVELGDLHSKISVPAE